MKITSRKSDSQRYQIKEHQSGSTSAYDDQHLRMPCYAGDGSEFDLWFAMDDRDVHLGLTRAEAISLRDSLASALKDTAKEAAKAARKDRKAK